MARQLIGQIVRRMAEGPRKTKGKQLLLHVGTGKTGSSSIQAALREADRRGYLKPLRYPNPFKNVHHEAITTLYKPFNQIPRSIRSFFASDDGDYATYVKNVRSAFERVLKRHDRLILSAEHLYNVDETAVRSLAGQLQRQGFVSVKVLLYLREPASLFLSQAQQRVKASTRFPDPNSQRTAYSDYVGRWKSAFDDVEVREFSPEFLTEGNVVYDFIQVMNRFFNLSITLPDKLVQRVNDSLSTEGIALVRAFRAQFYPESDNQVNHLTDEFIRLIQRCESEQLGVTRPRLKPSVLDRINFLHREEVVRLRMQVGEQFFPHFESPDEAVDRVAFQNQMADIFELDSNFDERVQRLNLAVTKRLMDS